MTDTPNWVVRGSRADNSGPATGHGRAAVTVESGGGVEWADLRPAAIWVRNHRVLLAGVALILLQLAWKAQFLGHLYFTQDDFYNLDLAIQSPLNWHYLTFNTAGNIVIGTQLIAWVLARISLYNWGLAASVVFVLLACSSLAALRLLRTLFGDRPVILVPLAVYLLTPLTVPDLGWWSAAMESVPLQLAIFMALNAHVWYVRTGRAWHLVAAVAWVGFGLAFFEKALVLPVVLFAVTAAFFAGGTSWLAGARLVLVRYWRAWLVYAVLAAGYVVLLAVSLRTSTFHPQAPSSAGSALTFAWALVKEALLPGAIGGPWQWLPNFGGLPSLAAPPAGLTWLALVIATLVVGASIVRRKIAWRSWVILAGWVVAADMLPVIFGRLKGWNPILYALETHYLADAAPILAICLGLAITPLTRQADDSVRVSQRRPEAAAPQAWRAAAMAVFGVFVFGSIWSAQAYENVTTGDVAKSFVSNAEQAVQLAPPGTPVFDWPVPDGIVSPLFGRYSRASTLIGDMARGDLKGRLHWITRPAGTIDGLRMFGTDGNLYQAKVHGAVSQARSAEQGCWPERYGQIVVRFAARTSSDSWELRIGYLWYPTAQGFLTVQYGNNTAQALKVTHGLHSAYLPVSGGASRIVVSGLSGPDMCIGDVEAGALEPY